MATTASILLPVHNGAQFVRGAIASALAQTCPDIEVIVVDDGSTDSSWNVILDCARQDRRVVALRRSRRGGPAAARNTALARATGRWLALLDADDAFLPERLSRLIARAEVLNADLLADNLLLRKFPTGKPLGRAFPDDAMALATPLRLIDLVRRDTTELPVHSRFGFAKPIIRRTFLQDWGIRYQEDIQAGSDFLLYCECVAHGARLQLDPGAWYILSVRPGSVSNRPELTRYHSFANRRIRHMADPHDIALIGALQWRQTLIDFDVFRGFVRAGQVRATLISSYRVPLPYLLRRTSRAACRRFMAAFGRRPALGGELGSAGKR